MITMLDVARKAGVSKSTVSRVLNGKNIVGEDVRLRVLAAIDEIGYRPNLLARQLATKQTSLIGFVMTNELYNGSYFSTIIHNVAFFSDKYNHQLILADGKHSADDERKAINYLIDMNCAGIVVYPQYLSVEELEDILSTNSTPVIVINRHLPNHLGKCVSIDHAQSSELLVKYVIGQGHKDIAYIRGKNDSVSDIHRYNAFLKEINISDITLNKQLVVSGDWSSDSGYIATKELIARNVKFTALIAGNDDMAFGAMKALKESAFNLPGDVSVAGFDNTIMCEYISPQLTSLSLPFDKMIELAVIKVIDPDMAVEEAKLKGELIIRESVVKLSDH